MKDKTQPDAGSTHIIRYALELGLLWIDGDGRNKVREALAALDALEAKLASIGAGGVQALSAAPAGPWSLGEMTGNWRDIDLPDHGAVMRIVWKMEDDEGRNEKLEAQAHAVVAALNAALSTPPAEQQAITPETGNSASAKGAAITSESGAVYAELPAPAAPHCGGPDLFTEGQMRDFADRTHALRMQAAPKAAPGEQLTREQIREVFMAHGFTIKEGQTDLKQYVYDAAYALLGLVAAPQQEAQEPSADVQAKIGSNTWDHFGDILPTLKAISRGDWYWGANTRCKYIEIRIDTRDGGCILYDSKRVRISPQQFAHQSHDLGKMDPWPAKNALGDTAPQPAPAPLSDEAVKDAARWRMAALIGNELMLRPDKRTHATAVKAYMDATHSGLDLTGAVDAALAAQGGKDAV